MMTATFSRRLVTRTALIACASLSVQISAAPMMANAAPQAADKTLLELRCEAGEHDAHQCALADLLRENDFEGVHTFLAKETSERDATVAERPSKIAMPLGEHFADPICFETIISRYYDYVGAHAWWADAPASPSEYPQPLRAPAYVAESFAILSRAFPDHPQNTLELANDAGEFLLENLELTNGIAGFPDWRGGDHSLAKLVDEATQSAERLGLSPPLIENGWIIRDPGDGSLYFDNGVVGEAFLELHAATQDPRYLNAAVHIASWASEQPMVPNFNYNAFSAALIARVAVLTDNPDLFDDAHLRIKHSVLSGMKTSGDQAGQWIDPHNQTLVYRLIMARALLLFIEANKHFEADIDEIEMKSELLISTIEQEARDLGGIAFAESFVRLYCASDRMTDDRFRFSEPFRAQIRSAVLKDIHQPKPSLSPAALGCFLEAAVASTR